MWSEDSIDLVENIVIIYLIVLLDTYLKPILTN